MRANGVFFWCLEGFLGARESIFESVAFRPRRVTFLLHVFRDFFRKNAFFLGRKAPVVIVRYFTGIFCWSPGGFAARYALFSGIFDLNFKKMGLLH